MLILFDIDATLVTTSRCGIAAMGDAGRALFGDDFDHESVEYAGRLDPLIIADLLVAAGEDPTPERIEAFRRAYGEHLARRLAAPGIARPCPGVVELLSALSGEARGATLALLTGNFPETGALKLKAAGLDVEAFAFGVWGCDSPHDPPSRDHLPAVAIERYQALHGRAIEGERVTIIGDTPHDVACGLAHGCRVLGVGTGRYSADDLRQAGAHLALEDLGATSEIVEWLTNPTSAARQATEKS